MSENASRPERNGDSRMPKGMSRRWFCRLEWKAQDCWVGVFWKRETAAFGGLDVWVCLLPMVPLHFGWKPQVRHG